MGLGVRDLQAHPAGLWTALRRLGVQRGDRVAIVMPQRFETAVANMAVYQLGAVAMPLSMLFGPDALRRLPNDHELYRAFFEFPDGPPTTGLELNGWGDDLVHDYLKAIVLDGRIAVLYSNKDYGCEWDYDFRNKRFLAVDNTG